MRHASDFSAVVRSGRRARGGALVVHYRAGSGDAAPLVGFVVGRTVGNSVTRHRVTRRLRAQMSTRLAQLPAGSGTVVRALPSAAAASSSELGRDLDRGLRRATGAS